MQCRNRECEKPPRPKSKYCSESCRYREGYLRKVYGQTVPKRQIRKIEIKNFSAQWLQDKWDRRTA